MSRAGDSGGGVRSVCTNGSWRSLKPAVLPSLNLVFRERFDLQNLKGRLRCCAGAGGARSGLQGGVINCCHFAAL